MINKFYRSLSGVEREAKVLLPTNIPCGEERSHWMLPFFSITFTIQLISSFYITSLLLSSGTPLGVSHPPPLSSNITTHWLNRLDGNTDEQTMNDVYGGKPRSPRSKEEHPQVKGERMQQSTCGGLGRWMVAQTEWMTSGSFLRWRRILAKSFQRAITGMET